MLDFVKKMRGQQHTYDHTLFIGGKLFIRFAPEDCDIEDDEEFFYWCAPEQLPNSVLEAYTIKGKSHEILGGVPTSDTTVLHAMLFDTVLVPGWEYIHKESTKPYELLTVGNIDREQEKREQYPYSIVYRDSSGSIWSCTLSSFCSRFSINYQAVAQNIGRLELVDAIVPDLSPIEGNLYFNWGAGIGFGQCNITSSGDKFFIQNEAMGPRFLKAMLCSLVDNAELENEQINRG